MHDVHVHVLTIQGMQSGQSDASRCIQAFNVAWWKQLMWRTCCPPPPCMVRIPRSRVVSKKTDKDLINLSSILFITLLQKKYWRKNFQKWMTSTMHVRHALCMQSAHNTTQGWTYRPPPRCTVWLEDGQTAGRRFRGGSSSTNPLLRGRFVHAVDSARKGSTLPSTTKVHEPIVRELAGDTTNHHLNYWRPMLPARWSLTAALTKRARHAIHCA